MTKTTTEHCKTARTILGVAVAGLALLASACGGSESAAPAAEVLPPANLAEVDDDAPVATSETETTQAPPDVLAAAITMLGESYLFESEITTPNGDQVFVMGSRVGTSIAYRIEAGGAVADLVVIGGESWIREDESAEWLKSSAEPINDPLAALIEPVVLSAGATQGQLLASYDAASINPGATGLIDVVISIEEGAVSFDSVAAGVDFRTTLTVSTALAEILPPV